MADTTTYPTGVQYREALFNTGISFRDPELRGGQPVLDPLGMPKAISGNFASVFTIRGTDGRRWAVKCFTRNVRDQAIRYEAVSKTLRKVGSQWKVEFQYLPEGVLCQGAWYPALKMEWVDATGLLPYIQDHLSDHAKLAALAGRFADLVRDLSLNGIAHGDLQHGNILVTPSGDLKLVDYDGMFVPGLEALGASEFGHPNYQSPLRTRATWGPDIDRFSSWVIYASLTALALDPALWSTLHADGDEALLFHQSDFADRAGSRARFALARSSVPQLREIASDIDFLWAPDLTVVPPLGAILRPGDSSTRTVRNGSSSTAAGTDWLTPQLRAASAARTASQAAGPTGTAAWLTTHLPPTPQVDFDRPPAANRFVFFMLSSLAAAPLLLSILVPAILPSDTLFLALILITTLVEYRGSPAVREKRGSRHAFTERRYAAAKASQAVAELEGAVRELDREEERSKSRLGGQSDKARADEQRETAAIDKRLAAETKRRDREIGGLQTKARVEEQSALHALQREHVTEQLRAARVSSAPGIGATLAATLAASGIATAADFTGIRYAQGPRGPRKAFLIRRNGSTVSPRGIGLKKAQSLNNWRLTVESRARATQPTVLPLARRGAITDKYTQQLRVLENDQRTAQAQAVTEQDAVRRKWAKVQTDIAREVNEAIAHFARQRAEKAPEIAAARERSGTADWQRDFAKRELARYRRIRYAHYLRRLITG
jgi:hypothetical protein